METFHPFWKVKKLDKVERFRIAGQQGEEPATK